VIGPHPIGVDESPMEVSLYVSAYFDDSMSLNSKDMLILAGWVSVAPRWQLLVDAWSKALEKHSLPHLHTSDFLSGEGVYRNPLLDSGHRETILREFVTIAHRNLQMAVGVGVHLPSYYAATSGRRKRLPPEQFCLYRLLRQTFELVREADGPFPIQLTFDDSSTSLKFYSALHSLKQNHSETRKSVAAIAFGKDEFYPPLQAADMLAFILSRTVKEPEHRSDPFFGVFSRTDAEGVVLTQRWEMFDKISDPKLIALLDEFAESR
jgi:hypothetical protein